MQVIPTPSFTDEPLIGRGPRVDLSPGRLLKFRTEANLTQFELAFLAGTTPSSISRLECGYRAPNLNTCRRLASALGIELHELVGKQMTVRPPRWSR